MPPAVPQPAPAANAPWTFWPENAPALEQAVVQWRHRLAESELFADKALLKLFAGHTAKHIEVFTMESDPANPDSFEFVEQQFSPEALLEGIKRGQYWVSIKRLHWFGDEYAQLLDELYDELERRSPGFVTLERSATLLISSPSAQIFYHADGPPNMLWHIRGRKKVFLYPLEEAFVPQRELEKIFSRDSEDVLTYRSDFEAHASAHILSAGDAISWPQDMPHRVENLDSFCISLSTEHFTPLSKRKRDTYLANYYLRRWLRLPGKSTELNGVQAGLKRAVYKILKRVLPT